MKTMSCKQLGGACDLEFQAETFEEMANLSQKHGREMFEQGDASHVAAMEIMQTLMNDSTAMNDWMSARKAEFTALPMDN